MLKHKGVRNLKYLVNMRTIVGQQNFFRTDLRLQLRHHIAHSVNNGLVLIRRVQPREAMHLINKNAIRVAHAHHIGGRVGPPGTHVGIKHVVSI